MLYRIKCTEQLCMCHETEIRSSKFQELLTWKDSVRTLMYASIVDKIEKAVLKRES